MRSPRVSALTLATGGRSLEAIELRPESASAFLVLAHGAGAGMRHPFMEALARRLAEVGIATLRYQFPYMQRGRRLPDPPAVLRAVAGAAIALGAERAAALPLVAGGKSMGGRITSAAVALGGSAARVRGLVFFGFPLHPAGRPGTGRADHLGALRAPMLFLQGSRDALADLALLEPLCARLGERARLHVIQGADHGFHVPRASGRDDASVIAELGTVTASWLADLRTGPAPPSLPPGQP